MAEIGESESQSIIQSIQSTFHELNHAKCDENENRAKAAGDADNKEDKDILMKGDGDICFICREKDLLMPDLECKVCQNIRSYHSKRTQCQSLLGTRDSTDDDAESDVSFPGPGVVKRSHIYGNYVVASRTIQAGELIILERPMTIGPYSPADVLPLCLSCCKDIGLSSKCSKCKWPVCGDECEQFYLHSENECAIFAKNGLRTREELKEYFSVETLRALLLRDRDASAWERILEFEPHLQTRGNDYRAKENTDFIVNFIRNKCKLAEEFSPEEIEHVVGVLSINTFWAFKELKRYASCLFNKITLFAHDCDPNTDRKLIYLPRESNGGGDTNLISDIALHVTASRKIAEGEMITVRYINLNQPVLARREELRETFYFDCTCSRCLHELGQLDMDNNNAIVIEAIDQLSQISL